MKLHIYHHEHVCVLGTKLYPFIAFPKNNNDNNNDFDDILSYF